MLDKEFILRNIIKDLSLKEASVKNTVTLIVGGATVPFIARYRKEITGNLDEIEISSIGTKLEYYTELEKRKETILNTIEKQAKLTPDLKEKICSCTDKNALEDIYLPYKPKKRTKATIAKEKGLGPLADYIYRQTNTGESIDEILSKYINKERGVNSDVEALSGALDIIAETISDNSVLRGWIRSHAQQKGTISSSAKKDWQGKKSKYENYYCLKELIKRSPSHRMLAIKRGTNEGILTWSIEVDEDFIIHHMEHELIKNPSFIFKDDLKKAITDSYKRLIYPSIEKEVFSLKIEEAEKEAIDVFSKNLRNLLLSPPAGSIVIMGIDPGFRTGCKVAVIDQKGDFKEYRPIYPHEPHNKKEESEKILLDLIKKHGIDLISIGNGTASKETDQFVRGLIKRHSLKSKSIVVSESGASVYSASKNAAKEFPDLDVTVRGAISIARRLQDPLAELVKIDPKSIGVGQYQHDVDQSALKSSLDRTVQSCVNHVGVDLNTASAELLSYVSGIGPSLAEKIVKHRTENSRFKSRRDLKKVPSLGEKAFEQCAGFLRIKDSTNPLDNSAIHPETYHLVEKIAKDLGISLKDLIGNERLISSISLEKYVTLQFGIPTLTDIFSELKKPGLDPRKRFESIEFSAEINEIGDLKIEMELTGTVTNVTNFGAFVDLGVHQDGLIHISKLSKTFVKNPGDIVSVGDTVKVKVLSVDQALKRISLERITS
ncbi:MAG: Tex family protein [archaeon]